MKATKVNRYHPSVGHYIVTEFTKEEKSIKTRYTAEDARAYIKDKVTPFHGEGDIVFMSCIVSDPSHAVPVVDDFPPKYYRVAVIILETGHMLVCHVYEDGDIILYDDMSHELVYVEDE